MSPLATTHTRQQLVTRLSTHFLSFHRGLAYLCIVSPCLSFLPFLLFHSCLPLCRMSIGADVSGPMCRPKSSYVLCARVSTLARTHARLRKSHDLPREQLSGDHGNLVSYVPSRLPPEPFLILKEVDGTSCARSRARREHTAH